jgi:plastocyanin
MRKLSLIISVVLLAALTSTTAVATDRNRDRNQVATRGTERFKSNALFNSTFSFRPGTIEVDSGDSATWVDRDRLDAPHTITVVEEHPGDLEELFFCREAGGACREAIDAHFPPGQPPVPVVNVGEPGLDSPGDSLLMFPGTSVTEVVSAPSGATLLYICAFHPWMQGSIEVE